eukprot:Skav204647  [mRNA]  locus=scaffold3135:77420:85180:- [translate_table: standard]
MLQVVTALLACEDGGVASSESLLVTCLQDYAGCNLASSVSGTGEGLTQPSEQSVFWLLYTLVCHRYNGMYREYYGQPVKHESEPPELIAGCGAIQDVNLLECCVAYHERDLFFRMNAYDTTTVIDLIHAADLYLWGGAGFSSGKASYLWTQRDEMFKSINHTTKLQNQILHRIAFEGQFRQAAHPSEQMLPGVTTKQLVKEVIPTLQINIAGNRSGSSARHWAMHRPMPLVTRTMLQSSGDKAWSLLSSFSTPEVPLLMPFLTEPPTAQACMGA